MTRGNVVVALALLAQIGCAPAFAASDFGFDPTKFGLPIYPGATLRPGTTASIKGAFGRVRRRAVLTTADPEDRVAAWYAAHWQGARRQSFPHMHMDQFATGTGATIVQITITNSDGDTEIQLMVPGSS
ncbi:MAG TPA: hypothetical protein VKR31_04905 [Rhizomicrobium sp.]|nr:hypothetical protein [Rhizomicrobium sp.]